MTQVTEELCRRLPKVDLHRHLEGALRPETLWEFHRRQAQTLHASLEALRASYSVPAGARPGFKGFLACFQAARFCWGGPESLRRVAAEAVEDAAHDGVIHLELRFSPVYFARRLLPLADPAQAAAQPVGAEDARAAAGLVIEAATAAAARFGIGVGFIVCLGRNFGWAVNAPAAGVLDSPLGANFCGLDLAGDEEFPASEFACAFKQWKAAGRGLTLHAGEDPHGPGAANVSEALGFGAERIGHGVRACEDDRLVARLAREKTILEMCPTSNLQTQAVRSLREHPLHALLESGVRVTLNTDDPEVCRTNLSREYFLAATECGLSFPQLRQCARTAAEAAFLPDEKKQALIGRVDREFSE